MPSLHFHTLVIFKQTRQLYFGFHQEIDTYIAITQNHLGYEVLHVPQHMMTAKVYCYCTAEKGLFYVNFKT